MVDQAFDDEAIRQEAERIRRGVEIAVQRRLMPPLLRDAFANFPRGCCGNVSDALAEHLNRKFGIDAKVICATKDGPHSQSHAWVVVDGLHVDITGDQNDGAPVIVTREPLWTSEFPEQDPPRLPAADAMGSNSAIIAAAEKGLNPARTDRTGPV